MFELKDISISVKDKYLIKNLSLTLNKNDKLAIIGEEGNGKTTLLKSILGICNYSHVTGNINFKNNKVGYLEQSISDEYLKLSVYNYLFKNDNYYYNKVNDLYKYLKTINLNEKILNQKLSSLSGGEKVKIGILKILLEDNDIYFLDEPTNDLDIDSLIWLENFINNTEKPIVYISHDETLLSKTANIILHIEQIKHKTECIYTLIKTNYEDYVETRLRKINKQTQISKNEKREYIKKLNKLKKLENIVEYEQNTISRGDPHGGKILKKKMHQLKSQEKKIEKEELTPAPDIEEEINLFFNDDIYIPKTKIILNLELNELKINDILLSKNIELKIIGNTHSCIIGKNGVGKSTLIKEIYKNLITRSDIKVGYMPQNYKDILNINDYVLDFIVPSKNKNEITKIRTYLGNLKFTKEEMTGKICELSKGSIAKLILLYLVINNYNVLILDEPTRNISPLSNPVIRKILKNFKGTIISVSHDRKYIEEVVDKLYLLENNGLKLVDKTEYMY